MVMFSYKFDVQYIYYHLKLLSIYSKKYNSGHVENLAKILYKCPFHISFQQQKIVRITMQFYVFPELSFNYDVESVNFIKQSN